jgi:exosome complex component RRP4
MDDDENDMKDSEGGEPGGKPEPRGKGPSPPLPTPVGPHDEVWRGRGTQEGQGAGGREPGAGDENRPSDDRKEGPGAEPPKGDLPEGMEPERGGEPGQMPEGGDPRPYREGRYEQERRGEPQGDRRGPDRRQFDGRDRRDHGRRDFRDGGRRDQRDDGHHERREAGRPPDVDRQLVLPGDLLGTHVRGGAGTYRDGESVYAACLGIRSIRDGFVSVIPLSGKYIPKRGDFVVGKVAEMTPSAWVIDLNSPYVAPLPGSETPWDAQFGEASKYMTVGDTVLVEIRDINEIGRVSVTMMGPNLRKLVGGQTIDVDASKVPRLIGRGGSMIGLLKRLTRCHMIVGQNGRIWLDGTVEDLTIALAAIKKIEQDAHKLGLTDAVAAYIEGMRRELDQKRASREALNDEREKAAVLADRPAIVEVQKEE